MKWNSQIMALCAAMFLMFGLSACDTNDSAAERAGDQIEDATDNAADSVEDAGDKVEDKLD